MPTSGIFSLRPTSLQVLMKRGDRPPVWQAKTPSMSFLSEARNGA